MNNKNNVSDIIVTLSSLYELLLNIGQSFDVAKNAEAFLKTLMLQKNLSFAAYYTFEQPNIMTKVYSIPKTEITQNKLDEAFVNVLKHNEFKILNNSNPLFKTLAQLINLPQNELVFYFTGSKSILVLGKKSDSFSTTELIKNQMVLNKFGLFMESLESHHRIKDEIKIKEEQAKVIKQNNEKLKKQNDDLRKYIRSNSDLEKFAHRVSHDLKSPVNSIIAFSDLFAATNIGNLTTKQNEYLSYIMDSGTQMKNLINGILDYSKISGETLKLKKINVYQLIEKTRSLLYQQLDETKGKIIVDNIPEFIIADEIKINQLFLNLISNALKFQKENEIPEVVITGDILNNEFIFAISDNGIGIPHAHKNKIFDLFSKLHHDQGFEGQGIGLSICRQIINQHKGEIWVESELYEGTIIYFTIPKMNLP